MHLQHLRAHFKKHTSLQNHRNTFKTLHQFSYLNVLQTSQKKFNFYNYSSRFFFNHSGFFICFSPLQALSGTAAADGVDPRRRRPHWASTKLLRGQWWCQAGGQVAAPRSGLWTSTNKVSEFFSLFCLKQKCKIYFFNLFTCWLPYFLDYKCLRSISRTSAL